MIKEIKEYLSYRRNTRIAKRELALMAAAAVPVIRELLAHSLEEALSDSGKDNA